MRDPRRRILPLHLSLRRLFLYLTLICLACGAIAQYPDAVAPVVEAVASVVWPALLVVPSLLVCSLYAAHSKRPRLMFFVSACGACMGVFLSAGLYAHLVEPIVRWALGYSWHWNAFRDIGWLDLTMPPLAALLVGGLGWFVVRIGSSSNDSRQPGCGEHQKLNS